MYGTACGRTGTQGVEFTGLKFRHGGIHYKIVTTHCGFGICGVKLPPMDDPLQLARQLIGQIDRDIAQLVDRKRKLQEFLKLGVELELDGKPTSVPGAVYVPFVSPPKFYGGGAGTPIGGSRMQVIADACAELLADGLPERTEKLLVLLQHQGVDVGGSNPLQYLSSILSRDDRFESSRKHGWSLATNRNENGPGAGTPEPSGETGAGQVPLVMKGLLMKGGTDSD